MNTMKEQILNEILEHTKDCDYNRSLHFKKSSHYSKWAKILEILQIVCLVLLITYYMLNSEITIPSNIPFFHNRPQIIPVFVSVIATVAQLCSYFSNFTGLSEQHRIAAQTYSRLYRECQFFCIHYGNLDNLHVLRQKAHDISDELNNLNLMAPDIDTKTYNTYDKEKKAKEKDQPKIYPIEKVIKEVRLSNLSNVIDTIKEEFATYPLEIILFGSYLTNTVHRDIDIAVIVYSESVDDSKLKELSIKIEHQYSQLGLDLDISVILQSELSNITLIPFLINIKNGHRLYISPAIKRSINDRILNEIDYKPIIENSFKCVSTEYQHTNVDKHNFVLKAYQYLYYVIAAILYQKSIPWSGVDSLERAFSKISKENAQYKDIYLVFVLLRKERNSELVFDAYKNLNVSDIFNRLDEIHNYICENQCF